MFIVKSKDKKPTSYVVYDVRSLDQSNDGKTEILLYIKDEGWIWKPINDFIPEEK